MDVQQIKEVVEASNLDMALALGGLMGVVRVAAEVLLWVGARTPNKVGLGLNILAKIIAYFGAGKPKKL